jgi:cation diffusion facilitator family transporter
LSTNKTIYSALFANLGIALTKLAAAWASGSSALLSEGVHSLVDSCNELLLLHGMKRSLARRSRQHPLGHGREVYFWSFIVALLVFSLGAGVSIFQGVEHLRQPEANRHPLLSYAVLAISALFDGYSFAIALHQFRANKGRRGYLMAIEQSKDPTSFAVLLEDGAALVGIAIAALGVALAQLLGDPRFDAAASIGIGGVLACTAALMARESKALLIGESAAPEVEAAILALVSRDPDVSHANGVITFHLAPRQIVAAVSVAFAPQLTTAEVETCSARLERTLRAEHPQVTLVFLKPETRLAFERSSVVRELNGGDRQQAS